VRNEIEEFCQKENYQIYKIKKGNRGEFLGLAPMIKKSSIDSTQKNDRDYVLLHKLCEAKYARFISS